MAVPEVSSSDKETRMKYLAQITAEFLKVAREWDDFSFEEQRQYLQRHPGSKRRLTARPVADGGEVKGQPEQLSVDEAKQYADKLSNKLTDKDVEWLHWYCQFQFEGINNYLRLMARRPERANREADNPDWQERGIEQLDKIFEKAEPINRNIILYRKVSSIGYIPKKKNAIFTEPAFTSTTFSDKSAFHLPMKYSKEYNITIKVPKGARPVFVYGKLAPYRLPRIPDFATKYPGEEEPRILSEKEAILPRDSKFKFIGRDGNNVTLELLI